MEISMEPEWQQDMQMVAPSLSTAVIQLADPNSCLLDVLLIFEIIANLMLFLIVST